MDLMGFNGTRGDVGKKKWDFSGFSWGLNKINSRNCRNM